MSTRRPRRRRRPVSAATRARISAALRGKKHPHRGVRPSAATRARESAAHKGKRHPHRGHRMSAATRAKISRALKGRHHKTRCHCGSSSKHSLTRRRAAHAQRFHGGIGGAEITSKVTKKHTKKRNKVHRKIVSSSSGGSLWAQPKSGATLATITKHVTKSRKTGKCRCPKKGAKHHARIRKTHGRATHHRNKQMRNRGKTTIAFTG